MRIYLAAYLNTNLGDDLFLKIISRRYQADFLTNAPINYEKIDNVKFINRKLFNLINKMFFIILGRENLFENYLMSRCDISILLGGSMFIEFPDSVNKGIVFGGNKPYYVMGANFGPYTSSKYFEMHSQFFSKAEDVCFRDEYSYNLFKHLSNVRYASDIVFNLDVSEVKIINNSNKVIISVIDCDKKGLDQYKNFYENKIIEMIEFFNNKGLEITLMSFCKIQGDEEAISSIIKKIANPDIKNKINKYYYNGKIDEALDIIGDSQIIVGTRFHANILGLLMNKTVIPIAYSDKTLNVLNDMDFKGKVFDIRDKKHFDVQSLTKIDLTYKCDISEQVIDAEKHFNKLDVILRKTV